MLSIYIGLAVSLLGGILSILKSWKGKDEKKYKKENLILLIGFILLLIGSGQSFFTGRSAILAKKISDSLSAQKERENKKITEKLLKADEYIIKLEKDQTDTTRAVLAKSDSLIEAQYEINRLTKTSQALINELNSKTDEEFKVTGSFSFSFDSLKNSDQYEVVLGKFKTGSPFNIPELKVNNCNYGLINHNNLNIRIQDCKLVIDAKVYDVERNLIAEVSENSWRINRNFVSKFNYDDKGFEVFDNKGRVALSVDIRRDGVFVRGILRNSETDDAILVADDKRYPFSYINESSIRDIYKLYSAKDTITPMFLYTGKRWRFKRI